MQAIDGTFLDFKQLEQLAMGHTAVHRLDPLAKVLTTACFILCVVSFDRYALAAMLPYLLFPAVLLAAGELPFGCILRKVLIVVPFALVIGLFNPLFDRQVMVQVGALEIRGGWISCASILLRAILSASAAMILVALTGFPAICATLEKLGMPRVFAAQLLFLYRYIFVLADEGVRTTRACRLRSFGKRGLSMRQFGLLAGHLLLRTWARAERIHMAMLARGFNGEFQASSRQSRLGRRDVAFMAGWITLFVALRLCNAPQLLGDLFTGRLP
jgi:cobalt/nickel transport system permease protein